METYPGYENIRLATEAILAWEAAGHACTRAQWEELVVACRDLGIDPHEHLIWAHGGENITSPDNTHGPFTGERCIYCNANQLDVAIYTLDPNACPPEWACGEDHPSDPIAFCQLSPDHTEDHIYEAYIYPRISENENYDPSHPPQGPTQLVRIAWARV